MKSKVDVIFDLEQQIMQCWNVVDDIDMLYYHLGDDPKFAGMDSAAEDEMMNLLLGLKSLYELKFQRMWNTFEQVTSDYHQARESSVGTIELDFPDNVRDNDHDYNEVR